MFPVLVPGRRKNAFAICVVTVLSVIGVAYASFVMTYGRGETEWPAMEVKLHVCDSQSTSINGANIAIAGGDLSYFVPAAGLTNDDGNLAIIVKPRRWRTTHWYLFWLWPIGDSKPSHFITITSPGFPDIEVPFWKVYEETNQNEKKKIGLEHPLFGFGDSSIDVYHFTVKLAPVHR